MYDQVQRGNSALPQVEAVVDPSSILVGLNAKIVEVYRELNVSEGSPEAAALAIHNAVTPLFNGSPLWDEIVKTLDLLPENSQFPGIGKLYKSVYDTFMQLRSAGLSDVEAKKLSLATLRKISSGEVNFFDAVGSPVRFVEEL